MTANKNEPDKKPAGSASAQATPRPHATIDLKATEVTPPASKEKAEVAEASKSKPAASDASATAAASATPAATSSSAASSKTASTAAPAFAKTNGKPAGAGEKPTAGSPPPKAAARGFGGFFTHVAAGLAGGIIALFGADMLAGQLGFVVGDQPDQTAALEQRLKALETAHTTVPGDIAARLSAAETKLSQIEQIDANLDGVSKKQAEFDKDINALNEKLQTQTGGADSAARIAKLEDQLSLMEKAGTQDPQSGRLPQIAAISGKVTDLELTMANQLDALRKHVTQEIDTRLAAADEAGQAARSGTQRIDRELSTLKAESAEMASGITTLKTDNDRAQAAIKTTQEDLKRLKADVDTRLATTAKPEDISSAVNPLSAKLTTLQQDVQGVISSEGDRRSTAERIVLSLELANLKRAIDRGKPYAPELAQTSKVAGNIVDLAPLQRFALDGVPTSTELRQQFKPVAFKIIDAEGPPVDASIVDRLLAGAKSVVRVRRTDHPADDKSVEAVVGRMETALNEDRLGDVIEQAKSLPAPAQEAAQEFLAKVQARDAVDRALASVETQLKASLAAAPADQSGKAAQ